MANNYKNIKSDRQWKATTALSEKKFHELAAHFRETYNEMFGMSMAQRQSNSTSKAHFKTYEDLLFFVLFSIKAGLTYDALGFVFNMRGSTAKSNQVFGLRVLKRALHRLSMMPEREFESVEQMRKLIPKGSTVLVDGEEQRTQRPVNKEVRKERYSGKKRTLH